jgi:hypothetical protein
MIDFVLDENVQIHGGNGFVKDYPAERHYRDARVNRIFEGTNEINRLLVPGMLIKRALKGGLPLIAAARALQDEILTPAPPAAQTETGDPLEISRRTVQAMKKTALMVLGLAMQKYGDKLTEEQELVMLASDVIMATFAADSSTLRAGHATQARDPLAPLHADAAAVLTHDAGLAAGTLARTAIAAMTSGDEQRTMLAALRRILKVGPINTIAARRRIADAVAERKRYIFV